MIGLLFKLFSVLTFSGAKGDYGLFSPPSAILGDDTPSFYFSRHELFGSTKATSSSDLPLETESSQTVYGISNSRPESSSGASWNTTSSSVPSATGTAVQVLLDVAEVYTFSQLATFSVYVLIVLPGTSACFACNWSIRCIDGGR